ncbi:MAG: DoxX family protein [Rikenellaceae bacterium]|nr:DoxX family protein [Rikenellaceae bacterium]
MSFLTPLFQWLTNEKGYSIGVLILRLAAGIFIMTHGVAKMQHFSELSHSFADPLGLGPKVSLLLIIFAEFGCAVFLIVGLFTRLAVLPLIFGMAVAAFTAHDLSVFQEVESPLLYMFIFISLFFTGAGRYSLDHLWGKRLKLG